MRIFQMNYMGIPIKNPIDKSLGAGNNLRDWQIYVLRYFLRVTEQAIVDLKSDYHFKAFIYSAKENKAYLERMIELGQKPYEKSVYNTIEFFDSCIEAVNKDAQKLREKYESGKLVCKEPKKRSKARGRGRETVDDAADGYTWNLEELFELSMENGVPRLVGCKNAFDGCEEFHRYPVKSVEPVKPPKKSQNRGSSHPLRCRAALGNEFGQTEDSDDDDQPKTRGSSVSRLFLVETEDEDDSFDSQEGLGLLSSDSETDVSSYQGSRSTKSGLQSVSISVKSWAKDRKFGKIMNRAVNQASSYFGKKSYYLARRSGRNMRSNGNARKCSRSSSTDSIIILDE